MFEQRRAGEADERGVGQSQPHIARESARLRAVGLVGHHNDVVPVAIGFGGPDILVELVDQAENITVVLLEQLLQVFARAGTGRAVVRHAAAHEGLVNLAVQVFAVGHQHKGEVAFNRAAHLFGKESHGVRLAAALCMPDHAKAAEVRVCTLNYFERLGRTVHNGRQIFGYRLSGLWVGV